MAWTNQTKNTNEVIYLVAEDGSFYLIGLSENETLVAQDESSWTNQTKNISSWTNQTKN